MPGIHTSQLQLRWAWRTQVERPVEGYDASVSLFARGEHFDGLHITGLTPALAEDIADRLRSAAAEARQLNTDLAIAQVVDDELDGDPVPDTEGKHWDGDQLVPGEP